MTGQAFLGYTLALLAMLAFASNILMTKVATTRLGLDVGFVVTVVVNVAFCLLAFLVQLALREDPLRWDGQAFAVFLAAGVFSTYLGRWLFFESIARLGPARASTFQVSSPLFTALGAWILLGERLTAVTIAAMVATVIGLYLVSTPGRSGPDVAGERGLRRLGGIYRALRPGLMLGVGGAMAYAVGNTLRGVAIHRWQEPILGALIGATGGFAAHFIAKKGLRDFLPALRGADRQGLLLYAIGGVVTISAQAMTIAAMACIPVSVAALITLCTPVVVFPLSWVLLRKQAGITRRVVVGCLLVLAGIGTIL